MVKWLLERNLAWVIIRNERDAFEMSLNTLVRFCLTRAEQTAPSHLPAISRLLSSTFKESDNGESGHAGACGA